MFAIVCICSWEAGADISGCVFGAVSAQALSCLQNSPCAATCCRELLVPLLPSADLCPKHLAPDVAGVRQSSRQGLASASPLMPGNVLLHLLAAPVYACRQLALRGQFVLTS